MVTAATTADRARAYAALVRVPNLPTAPPDVIAGAALASLAGTAGSISTLALTGLVLASVLLYAGGTTLNDAFDAPVDSVERPERPIPSGRVGRTRAFGLGVTFLGVGVATAFVAAGLAAGVTAGLLAGAVVLYDGVLKGTPGGFLAMGTARGLNLSLGAAVTGRPPTDYPVALLAASAVVVYVALVTHMAADETRGTSRTAVRLTGGGVALAAATVGIVHRGVTVPSLPTVAAGFVLVVAFVGWTGRALLAAHARPDRETVGPAVGTCVLALPVLEGAFAAAAGIGWAALAAWWMLPATVLARSFDVS